MSLYLLRRSRALIAPARYQISASNDFFRFGRNSIFNRRNSNTPNQTGTEQTKQQMSIQDANNGMTDYMTTRDLLRKGKLQKLTATRRTATAAQAGILVVFLAAFIAMPFLGKKIAQDDEFREKYIPSWYDYTVKRPEKAWTRDELHQQMLQVQQDIHARAIAGEFTPEKLQELQNAMQSPNSSSSAVMDDLFHPHRKGIDRSKIPKEWDMVHPGLDPDEDLDEHGS